MLFTPVGSLNNAIEEKSDGGGCKSSKQVLLLWKDENSTEKKMKNYSFFFIFQVQNDASQPTISRSSAVAPGGRYTPLSALASLQPGGPGAQTPQGGSRFQTPSTYQHPFAPHQGKIRPKMGCQIDRHIRKSCPRYYWYVV